MKVRLTRKFSNILDGIDLSRYVKGDTLDLPAREAEMLMLEGWAEPVDEPSRDRASERSEHTTKRRKKLR